MSKVGLKEQLAADGSLAKPDAGYVTSYANTLRGEWGYTQLPTSNYSWGSAALFERDCWAPPPTTEASCPWPTTAASAIELFEATAQMLEKAFALGKRLGVEACVGTETPLAHPLPPAPACKPTTMLGCVRDASTRVLNHTVTTSNAANSQEWCAGQCALAGLEKAWVLPLEELLELTQDRH